MKVKAIAAGLALVLGATTAQAQIVTSPTNGTATPPSELMLSVHNYTAGRTFVADLGSSFEIFRTMASGLLTWDLGALYGTNFSALGIGSGNDIRYNIVAYSRNTTNTGLANETSNTNTGGFGLLTTSNQAEATLEALGIGQFLSTLNGNPISKTHERFAALNNVGDNTSAAINSSYTTINAADPLWHAGANWGANIKTFVAGLNNEGTVGNDLAFWFFGADLSTTSTTDADAKQLFGNFKLASNGVLTYGSAAPVPVPGAVWLLGSALLGFIGLGSRKNKLAA
jgi:hypothetical protein